MAMSKDNSRNANVKRDLGKPGGDNIGSDGSAKPLILAVETSGRMGSVALAAGPQLLGQQEFSAPMRHSAELFPAIYRLLKDSGKEANEIEQVYVSIGPGSFTGLRIAATLAKTMHLANGARIVTVDTLDVIAANITAYDYGQQSGMPDVERIAVVLDAKRGQFFAAAYEKRKGLWEKTLEDCLLTAEQLLARFAGGEKPIWLLGEGLVYYSANLAGKGVYVLGGEYWNPQAQRVHLLGWAKAVRGEFAEPISLTPKYLRRLDVKVKKR